MLAAVAQSGNALLYPSEGLQADKDEGADVPDQTAFGGSIEANIGGGLSALADDYPAGGPPPIRSLDTTFESGQAQIT